MQAGQEGLKGQLGPHLTGLIGPLMGYHPQFPTGVLGQIPQRDEPKAKAHTQGLHW